MHPHPQKKLITHGHCADGIASAMIIRDAIPGIRIEFAVHGDWEDKPVSGVIFCDFAPSAETAPIWKELGAVVLDHHATAREIVASFGDQGVFASDPGVSGALLAYRHIWLPRADTPSKKARSAFVEHFSTVVGVRDTWQTGSPLWEESKVLQAALTSVPVSEWIPACGSIFPMDAPSQIRWNQRLARGREIVAKRMAKVERSYHAGIRAEIGSLRVLIVPFTGCLSDLAEYARKKGFNLILDYESRRDSVVVGCRSDDTFDAGGFATSLGGGGHANASGFTLPVRDLNPESLLRLVENFLRGAKAMAAAGKKKEENKWKTT